MKCRDATGMLVLTLLGAVGAFPAFAAERACSPVTVDADAEVQARWPEMPERIREAFATRDDIDACAHVELSAMDTAIAVNVALPDGRSASRAVSRQEDVVPTLEALLLLPAMPELPATASEGMPADEIPAGLQRDTPTQPILDQPSGVRIELSVATGARVGDGLTSFGLGALSFLDLSEWLVGFEGRADRYQISDGGESSTALELAALAGRRFPFGSLALDLVAGPALVLGGSSATTMSGAIVGRPVTSVSAAAPSDGTRSTFRESTSRAAVPRLVLNARLGFGARSTLRTFVGVDGEFGAVRASLPVWTVGFSLGATVGT